LTHGDAGGRVDPEEQALTGKVEFELEFRRLQREVGDGRDRQQKLDERLFRASIAASSAMNDRNIQVSILDPAYLPIRPVSKPRALIFVALFVLSFILGIATAALSALLDDRIYDRRDVERLEILPLIGVIPKPPSRKIPGLPSFTDES
jgi:hypothetical protein